MVETIERKTFDTDSLRKSSLRHNWMHMRNWNEMAEEGEPLILADGKGLNVYDTDGNEWLDVNGGYLCVNVGYGRTEIADAVRAQMKALSFTPRGTTTEPVVRLSQKLAEITPGDLERSWQSTGGSEANETAIKIAKAYHKRNGEKSRYKVISRMGSYHGATGLTSWLGGRGSRSDFEPAFPGMLYAAQPNPYRPDAGGETPSEIAVRAAKSVEDLILYHGADTVAAFIGEAFCADTPYDACSVPGPEYWPMVREICDRYGVVMIVDEVITGFGRTGKMFGIEHWGVTPDIMTMAKGLVSAYVPMAATIATPKIADAFAGPDNVFAQTLTFGGHPVIAAAALANIDIIEKDKLVQNAADVGEYLMDQMRSVGEKHPMVGNVRGLGLMTAMDLVSDPVTKVRFPAELGVENRMAEKFAERRLIIRPRGLLVFSPPLCITRDEVDRIMQGVDEVLGEVEAEIGMS
jgi:adenosylmethionine-8-amino-7-oxononanoate aminotransferase